jgi:NAD(P)-dependent dehydrogenase (short-subunit alcohol dehydrogenase family)
MNGLVGRVALVTGSSRGIGASTALAFAQQGADVAVNYNSSAEAAADVAAQVRALGRRAEIYQADVTSEADCQRLADRAVADFGRVDILVNNAGIGASTIGMPTIGELTTEDLERLLAHHVKGPFFLSKALLPQMRQLGRADIVMVSSVAAQNLAPRMGPYNIAKAGMEALAHTIAKEERQHGIRANIVAPGLVDTELGELLVKVRSGVELDTVREKQPFGYVCAPEDIANAIVFLCSDEGRYITNQLLTVNGGGF